MHPNFDFSQQAKYSFHADRNFGSVEEIELFLINKVDIFIIIRIEFSTHNNTNYDYCFLKYNGKAPLSLMLLSDFEKIKSKLPPDFKSADDHRQGILQ